MPSLRCGDDTAISTLASPIASRPRRWCIATAHTSQRARTSSAICRITFVAIAG